MSRQASLNVDKVVMASSLNDKTVFNDAGEPMGTSTPMKSRPTSGPPSMSEDDVDRDFWNLVKSFFE